MPCPPWQEPGRSAGNTSSRRGPRFGAAATHGDLRRYGIWLALAAAAALLLAFQAVVRQSVRQGDAHRVAVAQQTESWSVCDRMHGRTVRDGCRSQVDPIWSGAAHARQPAVDGSPPPADRQPETSVKQSA